MSTCVDPLTAGAITGAVSHLAAVQAAGFARLSAPDDPAGLIGRRAVHSVFYAEDGETGYRMEIATIRWVFVDGAPSVVLESADGQLHVIEISRLEGLEPIE